MSNALECDSPASFDLAGRALVIAVGKALRVTGGDGGGSLTITGAASIAMQKDSFIKAEGDDGESGFVSIESTGPVTIAADSKGIDVSAAFDGGFVDIEVQQGNLDLLGPIQAKASDGDGGQILLTALDGSVTVGSAEINATAPGDFNGGGSVNIEASVDVSLLGPIDLRGGDGGDLSADADGSIVLGPDAMLEGTAKDKGGEGALIALTAGSDVRLSGQIMADAPDGDIDNGGGFGGELTIVTETGDVELAGAIDLRGSKPDGFGGFLDVTAQADLTVSGSVLAGIDGGGFGGTVVLAAAGRTSIAATVDSRADDAGGTIAVESAGDLTVQGMLLADATGTEGEGGTNTLRACALSLVHGAVISATGTGVYPGSASNLLTASGQMTISGTLTAGDRNLLVYRDTPPTRTGATIQPFDPALDVVQDPSLPCCGDACAPPTSTTTSTTLGPATTTTSTTPGTTTPSVASTTTTTTTIDVPATGVTTSSMAPVTTPPTTAPPPCVNEQPGSFDAVDCRLQLLSDALATQPPEALGGKKLARTLLARVAQGQHLLTTARTKAKPAAMLRRGKKRLRSFASVLRQGQKRRRIAADLGARLGGLADQAVGAIDAVLSSQAGPTARR